MYAPMGAKPAGESMYAPMGAEPAGPRTTESAESTGPRTAGQSYFGPGSLSGLGSSSTLMGVVATGRAAVEAAADPPASTSMEVAMLSRRRWAL